MISHDKKRGQHVTSAASYTTLRLPHLVPSDSGNYTCDPENLLTASVQVHILTDSQNSAAAIHTDDVTSGSKKVGATVSILLNILIVLASGVLSKTEH